MANSSSKPIFCDKIGNSTQELQCCDINNQTSSQCQKIFDPGAPTLQKGCPDGDCIVDCQNKSLLYSSSLQDNLTGNGQAQIRRYTTCANVPAIAGYSSQGILNSDISSSVAPFISPNTTDESLSNVTLAVTDCLTQTCWHARNRNGCYDHCSSVKLLTNNTTPNIQGLNDCLNTLCGGGYQSLPYADADVIGIGVFASYIMQCIFVVLLCFGFLAFEVFRRSRRAKSKASPEASNKTTHQDAFTRLLVDFHKAQCYFSGTLQIASFAYGISETDMLVTFMLIPLATNGVLPVTFAYLLLFRYREAKLDITLLTITCWILSSVVYWILYANLIPTDSNIQQYHAYQQFMYKLSAIPACGGYSALAVCQDNMVLSKDPIYKASHNLRAMTPIIWTFSTVCLSALIGFEIYGWISERCKTHDDQTSYTEVKQEGHDPTSDRPPPRGPSALFWLAAVCFLAGIGMQLSLLAIGTSLNMMNRMHWSFGQIVAVTIWLPHCLGGYTRS